jgi:hypothetical protein
MGSKGNTWSRKLVDKERARMTKLKLGNEKGILARSKGSTFWDAARQVRRQQELLHGLHHGVFHNEGGCIPATLEDELPPEGVVHGVKERKLAALPMKAGWKPARFGARRAAKAAARWP